MDYKNVLGEHKFPTYEELKNGLLRLIDEGKISLEDAAMVLPELRESEDERVRKSIVETIKQCPDDFLSPKNRDRMLEWLEKQKEHSMSAEEVLARAGLKPYKDGNQWCILAGDNIQEGICGFGDTIEDALYEFLKEVLDLQKEQKPNYCHHEVDETGWTEEYRKAYYDGWNSCNMQHEQLKADHKPAEWSEEDENFFKTALWHISYSISNGKRTDVHCDTADWLKGVKERLKALRPQPKHEWTTYELNTFANCCLLIGAADDSFSKEFKDECIHFLMDLQDKSLRPSWKPSEEQMSALLWCIAHLGGADRRVLAELYEHLKMYCK